MKKWEYKTVFGSISDRKLNELGKRVVSIDEMIKATKLCTKSLMRLSYIDFCKKDEQKITQNKIIIKNFNQEDY